MLVVSSSRVCVGIFECCKNIEDQLRVLLVRSLSCPFSAPFRLVEEGVCRWSTSLN